MRGAAIAGALCGALAIALPGVALAGAAPVAMTPRLAQVEEAQLSPRLREITFRTPDLAWTALGPLPANPSGQTKVRVLLPDGYDAKENRRYPVLYLYHGGGGNQTEWTTPAGKGDAERLTKGLPLIVVMPEGGMAGGYSDWYNGGAYGPPRWKTYHLDQLIPWIDANFRTIASRHGRATAGLSMGGGGLRYAALRPDLIGATAAFSGDIDILQPASDWNGMGAPISKMIWGDHKTDEVRWRGANAPDLAKNLSNTEVAIFTGDTGRPEGVYILPGSKAVHDRLDALGIPHRFAIYPGMTHSWLTWNKALSEWLPSLMGYFARQQPASHPKSFSYSTIEPAYAIYGWNVRMQREALEFSAIEVAAPGHFTLFGSGTALVTTPVLGKAGAAMRITLADPARPALDRSFVARSDAEGRLSLSVPLGPANRFQQYTAAAIASASRTKAAAPFSVTHDGSSAFRMTVTLSPVSVSRRAR